jgi:hypothetical protein
MTLPKAMCVVAAVVATLLVGVSFGSAAPSANSAAAAAGNRGAEATREHKAQSFTPISDADLELEHATWSEGHENISTVLTRLKNLNVPESRVFRTLVFGLPDKGVLQMVCDRVLDKSNWFAQRSVLWAAPDDLSESSSSSSVPGTDENKTFVNSKSMPLGLFFFAGHAKHQASAMILMCVPLGVATNSSTDDQSTPQGLDAATDAPTAVETQQQIGGHLHPHFLFPVHSALVDIFRFSPTSTIAVVPLEHDAQTDALHISNRDVRGLLRVQKTIPVLLDAMVVALVVPEDKDGDPILEDADAVSTLPSSVAADLNGATRAESASTFGSSTGNRQANANSLQQLLQKPKRSAAWKGFEAIRMEARVTQQLRRLMAAVVNSFMPYFVYTSGPIAAQKALHEVAAWTRKQQARTVETASVNKDKLDQTSSDRQPKTVSANDGAVSPSSDTKPIAATPWVHSDVDLLAIIVALHIVAAPIPNRRFPSDHRVAFREMNAEGKYPPVYSPPVHNDPEQQEVDDYKFVTAMTYRDFHMGIYLKLPSQELESLVSSARKSSFVGRPFHKLFVGDDPSNILGEDRIVSSGAVPRVVPEDSK